MSKGRRNFQRPLGERPYRKMFVIAAEGSKTEPQYFNLFNRERVVRVYCIRAANESAPSQVLKRMEQHLNQEGLLASDEAWLVVDRDHWTDGQLMELHAWSQSAANYWFALSNPKFEYWLLLHFEEGTGIAGSRECSERLRRHLPDYDKGIDPRRLERAMIEAAIERARRRDAPQCDDWPRTTGTTVYRLVDRLLQEP